MFRGKIHSESGKSQPVPVAYKPLRARCNEMAPEFGWFHFFTLSVSRVQGIWVAAIARFL